MWLLFKPFQNLFHFISIDLRIFLVLILSGDHLNRHFYTLPFFTIFHERMPKLHRQKSPNWKWTRQRYYWPYFSSLFNISNFCNVFLIFSIFSRIFRYYSDFSNIFLIFLIFFQFLLCYSDFSKIFDSLLEIRHFSSPSNRSHSQSYRIIRKIAWNHQKSSLDCSRKLVLNQTDALPLVEWYSTTTQYQTIAPEK